MLCVGNDCINYFRLGDPTIAKETTNRSYKIRITHRMSIVLASFSRSLIRDVVFL